ncbi:pirin family protein [Psychrobium sp. 1_MG-2023]|uniref:pirin family protein n=1 Tax=Psychrobium sp. 1_MG-2023 TaxID=3062624 RepID=UPI000C348F24|nr:pirin family protein [Psychrobium sp. 1_MG-2023]MDP2561615.1 pirin family protein [Psychrobium sp. 1_MG-2023]PKF55633.1 pilus assembly protein [Alteromonadales bacterium alter-6D02]
MQILNRDTLPLGGFAGLTEHRIVTDERVFAGRKSPNTFNGLGNFVYLADAKFNPHGETHMHPHKEIDVITVMVDGQVTHEGSLEHGQSLVAGQTQVQRAGGEGFAHNEINPDATKNRLLQIWVLPDELGQPAGYKLYTPKMQGITRIYGGSKAQTDTFDSKTKIDIVRLKAEEQVSFSGETLVYVFNGSAQIADDRSTFDAQDGDLIRSLNTEIKAQSVVEFVVISQ